MKFNALCLVTMLATLAGCPEETLPTGGGSGGDGGGGAAGGEGGGGEGGLGGQAAFDAAVQENCDVQCCGCTAEEMTGCIETVGEKNAPEHAECNAEYFLFLDCVEENFECGINPMELALLCADEWGATNDCDDAL